MLKSGSFRGSGALDTSLHHTAPPSLQSIVADLDAAHPDDVCFKFQFADLQNEQQAGEWEDLMRVLGVDQEGVDGGMEGAGGDTSQIRLTTASSSSSSPSRPSISSPSGGISSSSPPPSSSPLGNSNNNSNSNSLSPPPGRSRGNSLGGAGSGARGAGDRSLSTSPVNNNSSSKIQYQRLSSNLASPDMLEMKDYQKVAGEFAECSDPEHELAKISNAQSQTLGKKALHQSVYNRCATFISMNSYIEQLREKLPDVREEIQQLRAQVELISQQIAKTAVSSSGEGEGSSGIDQENGKDGDVQAEVKW
eukprot:Nk52_evm7s169 gene=Nk52_evmTU7s169